MAKEKRTLNPMESHRRKMKKKQAERKREDRRAQRSTPLLKRDPSTLFFEIERLREVEAAGKADGPTRLKRAHLEQQFAALQKAREKAKLPTMADLPEFDIDVYRNRNAPGNDSSNSKTSGAGEESISVVEGESLIDESDMDLPPMPEGEAPADGIPGLPPYRRQQNYMEKPQVKVTTAAVISSAPIMTHRKDDLDVDRAIDEFLADLPPPE